MLLGGSPGLVVMGGNSRPKVVGSNPGTVDWMDIFSHTFVKKNCNVCLKRPKINEKEAGVGPFLLRLYVIDLHAVD